MSWARQENAEVIAEGGTSPLSRRDRVLAIWLVGVLSCLALVLIEADKMAADTLMNLYSGRYIWSHGVPRRDPFTVAGAGRDWIDGQWLANLIFYGCSRIGGLWLVGKLSLVAVASGPVLLARYLARRGAPWGLVVGAPVAVVVTMACEVFARAQDLAVPLFVLLLVIVADEERAIDRPARRSARSVAAITAILVLWANLHGSSLMAAGLVWVYAVYRYVLLRRSGADRSAPRLRPWRALAVLAPLTALATPYGFQLFDQVRSVLGNGDFHHSVDEWKPLWTSAGVAYCVPGLLFVIGTAIVAAHRGRLPSPPLTACVAILTVATIHQGRYSAWLGIAAAVALGDVYGAGPAPGRRWHRRGAAAGMPRLRLVMLFVGLCSTAMVVATAANTSDARALSLLPTAAVRAAHPATEASRGGVVLGDLESSALMLWLYPDLSGRLAFDPRLEIYRERDLVRWEAFEHTDGPAWFRIARDADVIVSSRVWSGALTAQLARPRRGWRSITTRDGGVLVRDGDSGA